MPETWQNMPKSAVDDETIEEAIARIIDEHNDDSEAHLGVGQSLNSHKASEIIDHLADSIIADKISRFAVDLTKLAGDRVYSFISVLDPTEWDMTYISLANVSPAFLGSQLYCPATINSRVKGVSVPSGASVLLNFDKDIMIQSAVQFSHKTEQEFFISVGADDQDDPLIKFRVHDDKIYSHSSNRDGTEDNELATIETGTIYVLRAELDVSEKKVYFYINGVLLATHETRVPSGFGLVPIEWEFKTTNASAKSMTIHDIVASFGR